jgi:uncharacterized membrane protein
MSDDDFDFDGFGEEPDDDAPAKERPRGSSSHDDEEWEELDWDQLDYEDLGYEPGDADRVRRAWRKVNARYSRDDLPSLVRLFDLLAELAGDALPPDTRRQLERALRELLIVIRDALDRAIERLDEGDRETEIEEIPID